MSNGGDSDGLLPWERRLTRLEMTIEQMKSDLQRLEGEVKLVRKRIHAMPEKMAALVAGRPHRKAPNKGR